MSSASPLEQPRDVGPGRLAGRLALRLAAWVGLAGGVLAPLAVHWAGGRTAVWFDTQILYAPQRWLVDEALRTFRLPLWNPFMGGGVPFLADAIHGVLHPVSVLTAWLGTGRSIDLLIAGHVACAGLGAALLARDVGASRSGAAATAFAYGASGFVLSMAGNLVFLAGAGSLPFCLAGLRRFAAEPRTGNLALGALGTLVLALTGDAQALVVGGALALALAWEAGGWRGAARAVAAGLVGLLLAGVQLLPTAAHLPRTTRGAEGWIRTPLAWALEPWRLPELVLPGLCFGPDPFIDPVFEGLAGAGRWPEGTLPTPFSQSVFVGLLPLGLALAGVRQGRRGRLLGALALALLWIALGTALGADAFLGRAPIWSAFRYSEKLVGPLTLVVAVLAGLGVDAVVEGRVLGRQLLAGAAALALGALGAGHLAAARLASAVMPLADERVLRGGWHVMGAAAALGGWLLLRRRLGLAWGRVALAALVWAGMVAASPMALRPGDPAHRLASPGPALSAPAPGPRIVTPYSHLPLTTEPGLDWFDQAGLEQAALGYAAHNVRSRYDSLTFYGAMVPLRLSRLGETFGARWPLAARRYAVTHLVLDAPITDWHRVSWELSTRGAALQGSGPGSIEVWGVPHRAWASFAPELQPAPDLEAALDETVRSMAQGSDRVVVEGPGPQAVGPGRVLDVRREAEWLRVEAEAAADATLVIADAWWPGWEATIDGVPVAIRPADVLVRAVRWPAGRHVLEMTYRPPEVRSGWLLSGIGLLVLLAGVVLLRRADRRRGGPGSGPAGPPPGSPPAAPALP